MKNLEKKCRIQLYDPDFNQLSDRLVAQDQEFRNGPKEVHLNPMRIEVSLFDQTDLEAFKEYLNRLVGSLPLEKPKQVRGRKPKGAKGTGSREGLTNLLKKLDNQETLLKELRELGFVATTLPFMEDMGYKILLPEGIQGKASDKWTFMVRLIKKAKNPLNNRYDPVTLVALRGNVYQVIQDGEVVHKSVFEKGAGLGNKVKVPAKAKMKFMPFLTLDERNQFRLDRDKLINNPNEKPSRLYQRWVYDIAKLNEGSDIVFPLIETIPNPYL